LTLAFFVDPSRTVVPSAPVGISKMSAEAGVTAVPVRLTISSR
jgi:hypothetical protein